MKKVLKKLQYFTLLTILLSTTNQIYAQIPEIYYPEDFVVLLGESLDVTIEVIDEDWSIDAVYDADTGEMLEDIATTYNANLGRKKEFTIRFLGIEVGYFVRKFYIHTIDSRGNTKVQAIEIGFFVRRAGREILPFFSTHNDITIWDNRFLIQQVIPNNVFPKFNIEVQIP